MPETLSADYLMSTGVNHHAKLGEYAAFLWKEKAMTDVLIVVQCQEFKAHKAVLACYSPYLKEVLVKPGFSDVHYLQLPNVTPRAFEILLEYMYTGSLHVNCQELSEVYRSARKLGIKGALDKCIELLHVTPTNFQNMVYLYVTARKLNLLDSSERAFKLMVTHFEKLITTDEFLDLDKDQLIEILSSDELGARSEIVVFLAALKWIDKSYLEREEFIIPVFECIRFPLMNMEEILACYHPPVLPGIIMIPKIRESLLNATCYIASKSMNKDDLFTELSARERVFLFEGEPIVLWNTHQYNPDQVEKQKINRAASKIQAWSKGYLTRKQLQEKREHQAATTLQAHYRGYSARKSLKEKNNEQLKAAKGEKHGESEEHEVNSALPQIKGLIFVMGACDIYDTGGDHNAIMSFDPKEHKWEYITRCPFSLHNTKMVAAHNALYIIGGCSAALEDDGKIRSRKQCYKYDIEKHTWTSLPDLNKARSLHRALCFQKKILAIGGKDEKDEYSLLSSIEELDESSNKWIEFKHPMPEHLAAFGSAVQDFCLWVVGGLTLVQDKLTFTNSVWCYDERYQRWYQRPHFPEPIAFPAVVATENKIICIGGTVHSENDEVGSTKNVYSFKGVHWIKKEPMPDAYHDIVASIIEKDIYVFGALSSPEMTQLDSPFFFSNHENKWENFPSPPEEYAKFVIASTVFER